MTSVFAAVNATWSRSRRESGNTTATGGSSAKGQAIEAHERRPALPDLPLPAPDRLTSDSRHRQAGGRPSLRAPCLVSADSTIAVSGPRSLRSSRLLDRSPCGWSRQAMGRRPTAAAGARQTAITNAISSRPRHRCARFHAEFSQAEQHHTQRMGFTGGTVLCCRRESSLDRSERNPEE
jgi:hypothetical protein